MFFNNFSNLLKYVILNQTKFSKFPWSEKPTFAENSRSACSQGGCLVGVDGTDEHFKSLCRKYWVLGFKQFHSRTTHLVFVSESNGNIAHIFKFIQDGTRYRKKGGRNVEVFSRWKCSQATGEPLNHSWQENELVLETHVFRQFYQFSKWTKLNFKIIDGRKNRYLRRRAWVSAIKHAA